MMDTKAAIDYIREASDLMYRVLWKLISAASHLEQDGSDAIGSIADALISQRDLLEMAKAEIIRRAQEQD